MQQTWDSATPETGYKLHVEGDTLIKNGTNKDVDCYNNKVGIRGLSCPSTGRFLLKKTNEGRKRLRIHLFGDRTHSTPGVKEICDLVEHFTSKLYT